MAQLDLKQEEKGHSTYGKKDARDRSRPKKKLKSRIKD